MRMLSKHLMVVTIMIGTPALAGEVTGTGESTLVQSGTASSICAYSGLNEGFRRLKLCLAA